MPRRFQREAGFSLLEVIIAVTVLSIAGLAILNGLQSTQSGARTVDKKANAMIALTSAAEVISSSAFPKCTDGQLPFADNPKLATLRIEVRKALLNVKIGRAHV